MSHQSKGHELNRHWTIYKYTFPDGKVYIGATHLTLSQRQGSQFKRYQPCKQLWQAIQECGYQNIDQEILFEGDVTVEEAAEQERFFIAKYHANDPLFGYNHGQGGEGLVNKRHYTEAYARRRDEMIRQVAQMNRGTRHTEESKAKMRAAKLGTKRGPMSAETKAKISRSNSRECMSEETRLRRVRSKQKKVVATNASTGEQIMFDSGQDVAAHFGVSASTVSKWVHSERVPSNGYVFQFASANND